MGTSTSTPKPPDENSKSPRGITDRILLSSESTAAPRFVVGTDPNYPAEAGRYHLYVAHSCPWAHRVSLARAMLGLEEVISMDVCYPLKSNDADLFGPNLWHFRPEGMDLPNGLHPVYNSCTRDTVTGLETVAEVYALDGYNLKSLPLLFDKKTRTVVNNDSAEILRMLSTAFLPFITFKLNLYPDDSLASIDIMNNWISTSIHAPLLAVQSARDQYSYEKAFFSYFEALDHLETVFATNKFCCGDHPTESDLWLFPPLFRHDIEYYIGLKLNRAYIREDYPNIWRWLCDFYNLHGVAGVSSINQCKLSRFAASTNHIVPMGPFNYSEDLRTKVSSVMKKNPKQETTAGYVACSSAGFVLGIVCAIVIKRIYSDRV